MDTQQRNRPPRQNNTPYPQPAQGYQQPAQGYQPPQPTRKVPPKKKPAPKKRAVPVRGKSRPGASPASRKELESKLRRQNASIQTGKSVRKPRRPARPMVYTQPKAFNRNRFLLKLLIVTASVLAFVMGMSIFFKVETVMVSGAKAYSEWDVASASGIQVGDNLLSLSEARASGRIQAELPYVNSVRIGIKLPNTVIIYIEELEVAYAIKCSDGIWWLITSEGRVVEQIDDVKAAGYTQIVGVTLENPVKNEQAVAMEESPAGVDPTDPSAQPQETVAGETKPVTITGAQRLQTVLTILKSLELNDIVGEASQINVSSLQSIELKYGIRYRVNLGDIQNMDYKIACMKAAIAQLGEYEMGVLDVSFTTWEDQVGYTPDLE